MDDFRRFPTTDTRQIIDYNRFMSLTGEKVFVCIDKGVLEIAKYLLNTRGTWRSTYVKEYNAIGYYLPTIEEFENVTQAIAEANIDMASCDDIVEAIKGISTAITTSSTSLGGCGCVGSGDTDVTDVSDGASEDIPTSASWEDAGFESQESYDSHRCDVAQEILANYIQTLRNWAGLFGTVGGLTIAVISGLLLLTVPPVGLILLMAGFGVIAGFDMGLLAELTAIANALEDDIDNLRCQLYNAATTSDGASVIRDAADAAVTSLALGFAESAFLAIVDNLISNDELSKLFNPDYVSSVTGSDCTGCAEGCEGAEWSITYGDLTTGEITDATVTITSVLGPPVGGEARYWIVMGYTCDLCFRLSIESSGYTRGDLGGIHNIGNLVYLCEDGGEYDLQLDNTPDDWSGECFWPASSGAFQFNSRTPFTVTVSVIEVPCE